ncbi:hypothetical protein [uncultured Microbacterium sp.]|uniref:hypothetical protein n=1 Tax=uncultured Microbacterium sp. TaxID=191216 RepID=UPI0028D33AF0|nr:hypothetical protein [uncultured Microbacterium sp.]
MSASSASGTEVVETDLPTKWTLGFGGLLVVAGLFFFVGTGFGWWEKAFDVAGKPVATAAVALGAIVLGSLNRTRPPMVEDLLALVFAGVGAAVIWVEALGGWGPGIAVTCTGLALFLETGAGEHVLKRRYRGVIGTVLFMLVLSVVVGVLIAMTQLGLV